MATFKKATKEQAKLRLALAGVSGSGKTYTSLTLGTRMGKTAFIDTEKGSASKYADIFDFDVLELNDHHPDNFIKAMQSAEKEYDVIVIDSLTHAWTGKNGCLELADKETAKSKSNNSYIAWGKVTPLHNKLISAILSCNAHVIATMRQKQQYEAGKNSSGKFSVTRLGMAPVQRDQVEFEFDIMGEMNIDNQLVITKSRMAELSGQVFDKPGKELADRLTSWCGSGDTPKEFVLPNDLQTQLEPVVNGMASGAVDAWLRKENRINGDQTWRNMDEKMAKRAIAAPDKFIAAVNA
jgi:hypothetical protein